MTAADDGRLSGNRELNGFVSWSWNECKTFVAKDCGGL